MTTLRAHPLIMKHTESFNGPQNMTGQASQEPPQGGLKHYCLALRPDLRRFLLARGVGPADAEDLLQDLFVRIETSETGPVRSPKAYLYQMLNNMAHTRRRTEMRRQSRDAHYLDGNADGEADRQPDAEAVLASRDELARVEAHLRALPERTAWIFRQYRVEGQSQKDIAQELGISLSAVEKHLQRAYKAVLAIRSRLDTTVVSLGERQISRMQGGSHDHDA